MPGPDDAGVVAVDHHAVLGVTQGLAMGLGQLAHDAEVEVRGPPVVEDPDVPGVHVAVEGPMDQRGLHPHLQAAPEHQLAVDAARPDLGEAVHGRAPQRFHADDPRSAVVPVHGGCGDPPVVAERPDVGAELGLAMGLQSEVQLLVGDLVQVLDHAGGVHEVPGPRAVDELRQAVHHPQVAVHSVADGRPLDLENGLPAVGERAGVHLGDGGGREGPGIEVPEHLRAGGAEVLLDHRQRPVRREGRHVVERAHAGVRERGREHPRRRGDELAQLHECGAERHERIHQAGAGGDPQSGASGPIAAQAEQRRRSPGEVAADGDGDVPREHRDDLDAAHQLAPSEAGEAGAHDPQCARRDALGVGSGKRTGHRAGRHDGEATSREVSRMTEATTIPGWAAGTWVIDPIHSEVGFSVRHLMLSKVRGRFEKFEGQFVTTDDILETRATISVDLSSINTGNADRDNDLRSANYFESDKYPTMTYRALDLRAEGDRYVADGELTVKEHTNPVPLEVEFHGINKDPWGGTRGGLSATGEINRKDFGITFDMPMEGGGLIVGDKIKIDLEIEAVLQA
jgi:polyisoprenoid-binding protein YceI